MLHGSRIPPPARLRCVARGTSPGVPHTAWLSTAANAAKSNPGKKAEVHCAGCGVGLQTRSKDGAGYIPSADMVVALAAPDASASGVICQRCYQAKHYGRLTPVTVPEEDFSAYLSAIQEVDCLVVHVVDIFDFEGSLLPHAAAAIGGKPRILVVNKCDLLPRGTALHRVTQWVRRQAKAAGVKGLLEVLPVSAVTGQGFEELCGSVRAHRKGRDVYVIGAANAGKSSFVNRLMAEVWLDSVPRLDPRAARRSARQATAVELTAPPPGLSVGDTFTGDMQDLMAQARLEAATAAGAATDPAPRTSWVAGEEEAPGPGDVEGAVALQGPGRHGPTARMNAQGKVKGANYAGAGSGDGPMSALATAVMGAASTLDLPPALLPKRFQQAAAKVGGDATAGADSILPDLAAPVSTQRQLLSALALPLTTSPLPGTTLGVVAAPLTQHSRVYDTPGVITHPAKQALLEELGRRGGAKALRNIVCPSKRLRQRHYRLAPGRSLFLGGLARLDYANEEGGDRDILISTTSPLPVHLTSTARAEEVFNSHVGDGRVAGLGGFLTPTSGPLQEQLQWELRTFAPAVMDQLEREGHARVSGNPRRTRHRRQNRLRRCLVEVSLGGFGWLGVTPIEIEGMWGWGHTVAGASFRMAASAGVPLALRPPLLPHVASGTGPKDWSDR